MKNTKKKRQQPRPKVKKRPIVPVRFIGNSTFKAKTYNLGKELLRISKSKEDIQRVIQENITVVELYFKEYDSIQLLGSTGLYLIDNFPNIEKFFMSTQYGKQLELDEKAEIIAEYAMNFATAIPNTKGLNPTDDVILDLRERLKRLAVLYSYLDIPSEKDADHFLNWIIHSELISTRGDGYMIHIQNVFDEMFNPHASFYKTKYGFTIEELTTFFGNIEKHIISRIGNQNRILGAYEIWERWREWEEKHYPQENYEEELLKRDFSKGPFAEFLEANPDVPRTEDGCFLHYQVDDYTQSEKIFWIFPQDEVEKNILETLSVGFGDNQAFLQGPFKGNIMNGQNIYETPFIKHNDRYYCFTPSLPYRNMFLIAEKLMKRDNKYYQKYFQQNTTKISRDNYVERKVKAVLESFLPTVNFYHSVPYKIFDNDIEKKTELDILGISDRANYIIEIKAHELSYKDRVRLDGAKEKFRNSVSEACYQCWRAKNYIEEESAANFGGIIIDKSKPTYKIAVTFHHHSTLLGNMDMLINAGLLKEEYRDTWIVSLFDLMVFADFIESEEEFLEYLGMHKIIYSNHSTYTDEIDVLAQFLYKDLARKVYPHTSLTITGGSDMIDEEYMDDMISPI